MLLGACPPLNWPCGQCRCRTLQVSYRSICTSLGPVSCFRSPVQLWPNPNAYRLTKCGVLTRRDTIPLTWRVLIFWDKRAIGTISVCNVRLIWLLGACTTNRAARTHPSLPPNLFIPLSHNCNSLKTYKAIFICPLQPNS